MPEAQISVIDLRPNRPAERTDVPEDEGREANGREAADARRRRGHRVARTICGPCEIHYAQPYLEAPLGFVGVRGLNEERYEKVFQPVVLQLAPGTRIWFCSLAARRKPVSTPSSLSIALYFYDADRSHGGQLVIDWRAWSAQQKRFIKGRLSKALSVANRLRESERAKTLSRPKRPKHPKVYFLPDKIDREHHRFVVSDHRRVCIIWRPGSD